MAPNSYIRVRNSTTGAIKAIIAASGKQLPPDLAANSGSAANGFLSLMWRKKRNDEHYCEFTLDFDSPDLALLSDKDQIEVIRSDLDLETPITEYISFDGIYRDALIKFDTQKRSQTALLRCYGLNHMLGWRDIGYPANKVNYTKFTTAKAETIYKRLVDTNLGANSLTANGRAISAAHTGFSVEADSLRGNTISTGVSHQNLLEALRKLSLSAGGDFNIVRTGVNTFQFVWVVNTDRTTGASAIVFSIENANMSNPTLLVPRSTERTSMLVGGGGEDDQRVVRSVLGPNYHVTTNNIEYFVDARNSGTDTVILDGVGAVEAQKRRLRNVLDYDVIQTVNYQVERDYFLSDKIKAVFAGTTVTQYVDEIIFIYKDGKEDVSVSVVDI